MLKNYLKIALRNFTRFKTYSIINILGLSVGITCFLTLTLFILDELSFDRFYKNSDQIYRIYVKQQINGSETNNSKTPGLLGPTLLQNYPEVQNFTRIGYFGQYLFRYKDKVFNEGSVYGVDSTFFEIFSLSFIKGDPRTALAVPNSIVLTKTAAKKYFGDENPVGKILYVGKSYSADYLNKDKSFHDKSEDFLITGLINDFPENSHFSCDFLTSISTYKLNEYWLDLWYSTYIVLKEGTDAEEFEKKMEKVVNEKVGPLAESILNISLKEFRAAGNTYNYLIQPMNSIYLHSMRDYGIDLNTEWGDIKSSDIAYIYIFSAVAIFILLLGVINFMNLATARSERRSKEVGIRKTLGSNKAKLIWQFLSEAVLMCLLSVILALALLELVLPLFNSLAEKELSIDLFTNLYTIPVLVCFVVIVGILAGSYPAFFLSSFEPVQVLKSNTKGSRKSWTRSILVVLQFTISIIILIGTIIVKEQLDYIQNKNLGFNKEHLYSILNGNVLGEHIETFKQELLQNSNIISVTSSSQMFRSGVPGSGYLYNKRAGHDPFSFQFIDVDYDFLKTYQVKMADGRFFSKNFSSDTSAVIINEAALKACGDKLPIGKELHRLGREGWTKSFNIIGVVKNFNYESLHQEIRPLAMHLGPVTQPANTVTIRVSSSDFQSTLNHIKDIWKRFAGDEDMFARFVDENLARLYETEQKIGLIAAVFSALAIFIACLGLFGLAAFVIEQRTKEIGVRKALGASKTEIIFLLSKEFALWVLIANIIAWPLAWYIMQNWLANFAFRIDINLFVFLISGLTAISIALFTVGLHVVKAAAINPVESLRYE